MNAISIDATLAEPHFNLGRLYLRQNEPTLALTHLDRTKVLSPSVSDELQNGIDKAKKLISERQACGCRCGHKLTKESHTGPACRCTCPSCSEVSVVWSCVCRAVALQAAD